jgi:hypothetical protein
VASLEELAFDLSVRALGQQERVLEELRARTGALLTAAALVTSFLGARSLDHEGHPVLSIVGLVLAIASIVLSVYVLAPKQSLEFAISGLGSMSTSSAKGSASTRAGARSPTGSRPPGATTKLSSTA